MPQNHPVDLKFGILSCFNKIKALLKFHQNCLTTSLIIHENMIIIYIQVISFHRFLKNAQNRTSDVSTLSLRGKAICIHVWQRKYAAFLQQRDQNNTLIFVSSTKECNIIFNIRMCDFGCKVMCVGGKCISRCQMCNQNKTRMNLVM